MRVIDSLVTISKSEEHQYGQKELYLKLSSLMLIAIIVILSTKPNIQAAPRILSFFNNLYIHNT